MKKWLITCLESRIKLFLASCKEDAATPKVTYDAANKAKSIVRADSTQIQIADFTLANGRTTI
jgi:hypothetical protein